MVYSAIASGRLYGPFDDEQHVMDKEAAISDINAVDLDDAIISHKNNEILVDEMIYQDGVLEVRAPMGDWYVSLKIPLRPSEDFVNLLSAINRDFDSVVKESGYWLSHDDVDTVDTYTADSQGRITLGKEYANEEVSVITHD